MMIPSRQVIAYKTEHSKEENDMENIEAKIILNIEIKDTRLINELNNISQELSLELNEFILYAIEKMLYDITFVRKLRN